MGMNEIMKKKAIPATSVKRSSKVVKRISRADVVSLNRSAESIIRQNEIERRRSDDEFGGKDSPFYGSNDEAKTLKKSLY